MNVNDYFRNNLATRNLKSPNEVEKIFKGNLQCLKVDLIIKSILNNNNQYGVELNSNYNQNMIRNNSNCDLFKAPINKPTFGNSRTINLPKPELMSVQIRYSRP